MKLNLTSLILVISLGISFYSCGQKKAVETEIEQPEEATENIEQNIPANEQHEYGGWYCPDNLNGFPPMDISKYKSIEVVSDRLPTVEETRNGTSLMFFDTLKHPDAKALALNLPRVAKIKSRITGMEDLVIVIQAATIGEDSVAGFRYAQGGNGTAWLRELTFLNENDIMSINSGRFVYLKVNLPASKSKVWQATNKTQFIKNMAQKFNKKDFFMANWAADSHTRLNLDNDSVKAIGSLADVWGNLYLQIDYDKKGTRYFEKMMISEDASNGSSTLYFVAGPFPNDFKSQKAKWQNWLKEVQLKSEVDMNAVFKH